MQYGVNYFFGHLKNKKEEKNFWESWRENSLLFWCLWLFKKMQEIDLLVYTLLDHDQVKLFDFLSRPPLKIDHDKLDIYNEFQSRQSLFVRIGKRQIDDLYKAYNNIRIKEE